MNEWNVQIVCVNTNPAFISKENWHYFFMSVRLNTPERAEHTPLIICEVHHSSLRWWPPWCSSGDWQDVAVMG